MIPDPMTATMSRAGAERFGDEPPAEVGADGAGAGLGLVGQLGHQAAATGR